MLWKFNYVYKYFSEFSILINSKFLLIILPIIFTEQFCFKKRILHWWAKSVLGLRPDLARPSLLLITKIKKTKKMWYTVFPFFCHPSERCIFAKVELRWPSVTRIIMQNWIFWLKKSKNSFDQNFSFYWERKKFDNFLVSSFLFSIISTIIKLISVGLSICRLVRESYKN